MNTLIERLIAAKSAITDANEQTKMALEIELGALAEQFAEAAETLQAEAQQLAKVVDRYENESQSDGGWRWTADKTLAERTARIVEHYQRMATRSVESAMNERKGIVSWLRAIAICAQAVSWAETHREKDARLRGMIEVIETSITRIQDMPSEYAYFDGGVDSWAKSDFPTRDMKRRILDQQAEIARLQKLVGENVTDACLRS